MYPVFFSVSSSDVEFAQAIWRNLPQDWVYLYSESGQEGAEFWDEISRKELPLSKFFVIFWSENYVNAPGCLRELKQAAALVQNGILSPLILRLDEYPLAWKEGMSLESKLIFEDLKAMLGVRTSRQSISVQDARHLVQRFIEPTMNTSHPMFPRDDVLEAVRAAAQRERFKCFPAMWISGFPGAGRTTVVEQLNLAMAPNGRPVVIDINAASLPKQICLKLESIGLGAGIDRLEEI